ncbi:MAG: hypothetical protein GWO16_03500 [Gammaproteobacteria bacterium]|nr:hypothetical protein [Gammaproteobacteria bacterium]NIR97166.1 hypothetical protein [Gammaproteobacteria bacterium]NIT62868.1 hypothetical protein [Gammaproteobacteria bacterium]NIV19833.1 hypothetical protein [Gammaproteobacteria bacterium]NIY31448.1 hypothetical protein [Gammaproteobacteria bacterium]
MWSPLTLLALVLAALSVTLLIAAVAALRRRRLLGGLTAFSLGMLLLAGAALAGTLSVAVQGYRAFTREQVAARVTTEPLGGRHFLATVHFPDGRRAVYKLVGDQLYVDAQILKWKPIANVLGLHTAYKLDRIAGRYTQLKHERNGERTVYALTSDGLLDLFDLRGRYALLSPLVDTEYGSASYVPVDRAATFEVRVSTSGLLIRNGRPEGHSTR